LLLLAMFLVPPVVAWLCGVAHGKGGGGNAPWKYFYSVLVYLTCVPGTFAAVITAYTLFFTRENLMDVNPLVYFLPLASMVATLVLIHKNVTFDLVPGFDRLEGLMVMIACSFVLALAIQKTKIWSSSAAPSRACSCWRRAYLPCSSGALTCCSAAATNPNKNRQAFPMREPSLSQP